MWHIHFRDEIGSAVVLGPYNSFEEAVHVKHALKLLLVGHASGFCTVYERDDYRVEKDRGHSAPALAS